MTCREIDDRIEAVAAGDEPASEAFRAHVEGCLRCAAALARATRIEAVLAGRPAPAAPPRFTAAVAARIRRDYWRSEQQVDRLFNVAVAIGVIAIVGAALALLNLTTVTAAVAGLASMINSVATESAGRVNEPTPMFSTYLLAGGFLLTALLVWWWAEKRWSV